MVFNRYSFLYQARPIILYSGWSVSLSSDGGILAVGSPFESDDMGATWIFVSNSATGTYDQLGTKLVGNGSVFPARQGNKWK